MDQPQPDHWSNRSWVGAICGIGMIIWCCHLMYQAGYNDGYKQGKVDIEQWIASPLPQSAEQAGASDANTLQ